MLFIFEIPPSGKSFFFKGFFLTKIQNSKKYIHLLPFFPHGGILRKIKTTLYFETSKLKKDLSTPTHGGLYIDLHAKLQSKMLLNISLNYVSFQGKTSHKFMDETSNPVIRIYYTSRPVLFGMCAGNEIFYASLYLLHFTNGPFYIFNITAVLCFPVAIAKLAIALFQVCDDELIHLGPS